jgi:LAS superfamily LD-carboxypeptidase LdcB
MAVVQLYERTERLNPDMQGNLTTRSSPDDFGASIGQGMQGFAQGLAHVGKVVAAVKSKENETRAKQADDAYAAWLRDKNYNPETGFMHKQGADAVNGWEKYQSEVEEVRKKFGSGLTGEAAELYTNVSKNRTDQSVQSGMIKTGQERKAWFKNASESRLTTFQQDAVAGYQNPKTVETNIGSGIMELRNRASDEGWDADTLKVKESEFASSTRRNVVLRMAEDDPLSADAYYQKHKDKFVGTDQYAIGKAMEEGVANAKGLQEADRILSGGRVERDAAPVANAPAQGEAVPKAAPATRKFTTSTAKEFLSKRIPGKGREAVDGIDDGFATNLAAMIQDAPPEIRDGLQLLSGYRSVERQEVLFRDAVRKYGSPAAARKWVAPPGKSEHNHGSAADLMWNGQRLEKAPVRVTKWVHDNAGNYGMHFPMSWEAWHIEPNGSRGKGSTVVARGGGVSHRASAPSVDDLNAQLESIADPKVREVARRQIEARYTANSKQQKALQDQAEMQVFAVVEQGGTPDDVPLEVRLLAGQSTLTSAWSYHDAKLKRGEPETDQTLLYSMRRAAASDPNSFAQENLMQYRDKLDNTAFKELTDLQTSALKSDANAVATGKVYADAYNQADTQLESLGLSLTGKKETEREAAAKRIALFQNGLKDQIDGFRQQNNRLPEYAETQKMIMQALLPVVMKKQDTGMLGNMFGGAEREGFLFESPARVDGENIDVAVKYESIPIEMRGAISKAIEAREGRVPTAEEIEQEYEDFILGRPAPRSTSSAFDPVSLRRDLTPTGLSRSQADELNGGSGW